MSDTYLFVASLLYFVPVAILVAATSLAAFGRELIPFTAQTSQPAARRNTDETGSSCEPSM
jgi:hypothetical protein